jgi:hypothetical protein
MLIRGFHHLAPDGASYVRVIQIRIGFARTHIVEYV